jgi:hypothetical protein
MHKKISIDEIYLLIISAQQELTRMRGPLLQENHVRTAEIHQRMTHIFDTIESHLLILNDGLEKGGVSLNRIEYTDILRERIINVDKDLYGDCINVRKILNDLYEKQMDFEVAVNDNIDPISSLIRSLIIRNEKRYTFLEEDTLSETQNEVREDA